MSNTSVRIPTLAMLAVLLSVSAGLALPEPPETMVAVPFNQPEDQGDQDGFLLLSWDAVDGADGYRIWRELLVTAGLDEEGKVIDLDTPEYALVPWGRIVSVPGQPVVRAVVATLDGDMNTRWAVTTVQNTDDGPVESEPRYFHVQVEGIGTGVQPRSWGDVKQLPQKDAR